MLQFSWLLLWLKSLLHSRDLSFQSQGCCCCHRFLFRQEREAACFDRTLGCPRFPVCAVSMAPSPEVGKMRWAPKSLQSAGSFLALPVNPSRSPSHPFLLIFILYLCITGPLKNSSKGLALLNIKMYCKAAISKTMWQRFRNKQIALSIHLLAHCFSPSPSLPKLFCRNIRSLCLPSEYLKLRTGLDLGSTSWVLVEWLKDK